MNKKNQRPVKAAFLWCLLLILGACARPESKIGTELQPEDQVLSLNQSDTITLVVSTVKEEPLVTEALSVHLIGNYNDPVFGTSKAGFYSQLLLSTNSPEFGDSIIAVDSLILSLAFTGDYYGEVLSQRMAVYEINDPSFSLGADYKSSDSLMLYPGNLIVPGMEDRPFSFDDSVKVGNQFEGPQLRLPLHSELAYKLLQTPKDSLNNSEVFVKYFNGLRVISEADAGCVANIDPQNDNTSLRLYYRRMNNNQVDTLVYPFIISTRSARFNTYEHDYSHSSLAPLDSQDSINGSLQAYVQAGASVKTRINFPSLDGFEAALGTVATVNKAELILPAQYFADFAPISTLFLLQITESGEGIILPDQTTNGISIGGEYNADNQEYRFIISRYVQQVLNGTLDNNGLYLVATSAGVSVKRTVLNGPDFNPEDVTKNMRLVLTLSY